MKMHYREWTQTGQQRGFGGGGKVNGTVEVCHVAAINFIKTTPSPMLPFVVAIIVESLHVG